MKDYREMAESVFEKGDKILAERQKRRMLIRNISFSSAGVCAVLFVAFTVWHDPDLKKAPEPDSQPDTIIIEETNSTSTKTAAVEFSTEHSLKVEKTTTASYTIINSITSSTNTTASTIYNSIPVSTASSYTIYNSIPTTTVSTEMHHAVTESTHKSVRTTVSSTSETTPVITRTETKTAETTTRLETATIPQTTPTSECDTESPVTTKMNPETTSAKCVTTINEGIAETTASKQDIPEILPENPNKIDQRIVRSLQSGNETVNVKIYLTDIDMTLINEETERLADEYVLSISDKGYTKKKIEHYRDVFCKNKLKELAAEAYHERAVEAAEILGVEEYTIDQPDTKYISKPVLYCDISDISQLEKAEKCDLISKVRST